VCEGIREAERAEYRDDYVGRFIGEDSNAIQSGSDATAILSLIPSTNSTVMILRECRLSPQVGRSAQNYVRAHEQTSRLTPEILASPASEWITGCDLRLRGER
jgi:hypothetical protein